MLQANFLRSSCSYLTVHHLLNRDEAIHTNSTRKHSSSLQSLTMKVQSCWSSTNSTAVFLMLWVVSGALFHGCMSFSFSDSPLRSAGKANQHRLRLNHASRLHVQKQQSDNNTTQSVTTLLTSPTTESSQPTLPTVLLAEPEETYIECQFEDYFDGTKPDASWNLAIRNFIRQGSSILKQAGENIGLIEYDGCRPPDCLGFKLSNEAVKLAEERRVEQGGSVDAHPVSRALYDLGCLFLDELFDGRPIQRFWFLEVIARIPYFSYVSMLHLYESFGWFRAVELRKVHAAEDWNELHHLLIMESLGGNTQWYVASRNIPLMDVVAVLLTYSID